MLMALGSPGGSFGVSSVFPRLIFGGCARASRQHNISRALGALRTRGAMPLNLLFSEARGARGGMRACVRVLVRACMRACVRACVCLCACVRFLARARARMQGVDVLRGSPYGWNACLRWCLPRTAWQCLPRLAEPALTRVRACVRACVRVRARARARVCKVLTCCAVVHGCAERERVPALVSACPAWLSPQ